MMRGHAEKKKATLAETVVTVVVVAVDVNARFEFRCTA